ncbi:ABC transporter, ATP-binding protein, partial [human gut metagenome]
YIPLKPLFSKHKGGGVQFTDEPTGNLDSQTELEVMSLLKSCVSDFGQTLIMITHDETIAQMADEMIIIEDGKAVRR